MPDRNRPAGKNDDIRYVFVICRKHLNDTDMEKGKRSPDPKVNFRPT